MDDKDRINKDSTTEMDREGADEFDIAGNVRDKGQSPSPGDRDRGELSEAEPEGEGGAGGTKRH